MSIATLPAPHTAIPEGLEHHRLLTRRQAAALLGVSVKTMANWAWSGQGPTTVRVGGAVRYRLSAILDHVSESAP